MLQQPGPAAHEIWKCLDPGLEVDMLLHMQSVAGRARHRAAQKRYRQRQRAKMNETDQRFEALEQELKELRMKEVPAGPCPRNPIPLLVLRPPPSRVLPVPPSA